MPAYCEPWPLNMNAVLRMPEGPSCFSSAALSSRFVSAVRSATGPATR